MTLLDALRNRADLTGNKRVCDRGTCGACTMIVDGRTVYSCSTLAIEVQGKQIRTVDGLAARRHAAPGAAGVLRHRRPDVRLLHAGLRHRHVALLEKHPNATREQISKGLDGNICRCGTFVRIMEAALKAQGQGGAWLTSTRGPRSRR